MSRAPSANAAPFGADPALDLFFERDVDVAPSALWRGWTQPDRLMQWFTPAPWKTVACEIDLRPGGIFSTVMRSPEGQEFSNVGCYLEVVENLMLVWTNALLPGFRPPPKSPASEGAGEFAMTATISMSPSGRGTRYRARVQHGDPEARARHAAMNFEQGWGMALDQLVALIKREG